MQIPLGNDPLYNLLIEQVNENRQLLWMTWGLIVLTWGILILQGAHLLRRFFGTRAGAPDMFDDLDVKTFYDRLDEHDRVVAETAQAITTAYVNRFNAIDKQLELERRRTNTLLIIMRDLRAYTIYHSMPDKELIPIETDADFPAASD